MELVSWRLVATFEAFILPKSCFFFFWVVRATEGKDYLLVRLEKKKCIWGHDLQPRAKGAFSSLLF
jgi:hypothetical protein